MRAGACRPMPLIWPPGLQQPCGSSLDSALEHKGGRGGEETGSLAGQRTLCRGPMPPGPQREWQRPPGQAEKGRPPGGRGPSGRVPLLRTGSVCQNRPPEGQPPKIHGDPRSPRKLEPGQKAPARRAMSAPPQRPRLPNVCLGGGTWQDTNVSFSWMFSSRSGGSSIHHTGAPLPAGLFT